MLSRCSSLLGAVAVVAAVTSLVLTVVYVGFDHTVVQLHRHIMPGLRMVQVVFVVQILLNIVLRLCGKAKDARVFMWVIDSLVLLTALAWIYPRPMHPWFPALASLVYSHLFLMGVLAAYSCVTICFAVIRLMGHHVNPSLLLSCSFIFFIVMGSLALMMPRCTLHPIDYADSLFVSTSAVCICGLTTLDVPSTFSTLGQCVLMLLMQIGALGVLTFTSFFALFFSGNSSIYSQLMVKDMVYSKSINSLLPTLLYILSFTLCIEAVGAVAIYFDISGTIPGMTHGGEMLTAVFHSISAFCNSGFSNLPGGLSNPALMHSAQTFYLIMAALIAAGGIGFPILVNAKDAIAERIGHLWRRLRYGADRSGRRVVHIYSMNTRVALMTTTILFLITAAGFGLAEWHHSLEGMTTWQKCVQTLFNAVNPRSAGFATVHPAGFLNVTLLMTMLMMWIGGASQSTAGGIKVNTIAVLWLHLRSTLLSRQQVTAYGRAIAPASIQRAIAVVSVSIAAYFIYASALLICEPGLPARSVLFEALSALFTVGSSLGITPELGLASKLLLCSAMLLGRVGILSLLVGFIGHRRNAPVSYPTDNIIIN
jgi:Trk-type K+ transport system membrane component